MTYTKRLKKIKHKLRMRTSLPFPAMRAEYEDALEERATKILDYIMDREDRMDKRCEQCWEKVARKSCFSSYKYIIDYNNHADEIYYFCSETCRERYYEGNGSYCEGCDHDVTADSRWYGDYCLTCGIDEALERGMSFYDFIDEKHTYFEQFGLDDIKVLESMEKVAVYPSFTKSLSDIKDLFSTSRYRNRAILFARDTDDGFEIWIDKEVINTLSDDLGNALIIVRMQKTLSA